MREPGRQPTAAGVASGPAVLVIFAVALLGPAAAAAIWPGPCGDAMRDGAGLPVGLVPAAARARGVTDEGLAPIRGVGTGHADCRNSSRVTQGSPRRLSPPSGVRGLPPICYGTRLLWDAPGARPVHVPARHAVQVQMDPLAVRSHATGSGGRPALRRTGDLAGAASSHLRHHRHIRRSTGHIASPHGGAYGRRYRISSR
jgi:hypothetical protein